MLCRGYYCMGAWVCIVVSDTMMYVLTVWKTFKGLRGATVKHSLFRVLFFNGMSKRSLPEY